MEEILTEDDSNKITTNLDWIRLRFVQHDSFRYKICNRHIIQLQIKGDYKTRYISNEGRDVVDDRFAKYRSNYMYVNAILNMKTKEMENEIIHIWNQKTSILYKVGTFVYPDFFDPIDRGICAHGIHFFKTLEGAYFYDCTTFYEQSDINFHQDGMVIIRQSYFVYGTPWSEMITFMENKYHLDHLISEYKF